MRALLYYFWIAPQVLHGVILAFLFRKRLNKEFPLFTTYIVFDLSRFFVLFALWFISRHGSYKWVGISTELIITALAFGVIYNLSNVSVIGPPMVLSLLRSWLAFIGVGCVLISAIISATISAVGYPRSEYVFFMVDISSSIILTGSLVALFAFTRISGLAWRSRGFGVAVGFGISQSVFLVVAALRPLLDRSAWMLFDNIDLAAYHVTVVIWLIYFIRPERVLQFSASEVGKMDLESWNQQLSGMVQ